MFIVRGAGGSFLPSGMTKNGSFTLATSYSTVTSWTADTTNYPGSTVSSDGLVVQGGKSGASVNASLVVSNSNPAGVNATLRLILNGNTGSPLATGSAVSVPAFGSTTVTVSATANLSNADVVTVQALAGAGGLTTTTNASSFMHIT